ncbi:hypothetical protein [Streptomyces sp. B8F3]|uniref:hypothetical protein n=1 Tax=unclassified Streptomyces TaxID=2593676 RepID=UPI00325FB2F0
MARTPATLIELATALEETEGVGERRRRLGALDLTDAERHRAVEGLRNAEALRLWHTGTDTDGGG